MNRAKKEELLREKGALDGLSEEEKKALYIAKDEEEALQKFVREFHIKLFPEEYDRMHDSFSDARDRSKGVNPMNDEYIRARDNLRKELGFSPFNIKSESEDTYGWVYDHLKNGRREYLEEILKTRNEQY